MVNGNLKFTHRNLERLLYILTIIALVVGWAVSWGKSLDINKQQDERIKNNRDAIIEVQRKCDIMGGVTATNSAKLDLLLEHFGITNRYETNTEN